MHRLLFVLLLLLPLMLIAKQKPAPVEPPPEPLQTWNPETFVWSTVLIWVERPIGTTLTTGVLIDKEKRHVLVTRHALEKLKADGSPDGLMGTVYIVWPRANAAGTGVVETSDYYFQARRKEHWQPARVLVEDPTRDLVLLQAPTPPPEQARAITLETETIPPGTQLMGIAQPFTRGGLWHGFTAVVQTKDYRRLSYSPHDQTQPVALYVAQGEQPVEFGYSGSPLVLPHSGKLAGMLLAAQLDQPRSYVLISSQEIQQFLRIE